MTSRVSVSAWGVELSRTVFQLSGSTIAAITKVTGIAPVERGMPRHLAKIPAALQHTMVV